MRPNSLDFLLAAAGERTFGLPQRGTMYYVHRKVAVSRWGGWLVEMM